MLLVQNMTPTEALEWIKSGNRVMDENGHYSIINGIITLRYHEDVQSPIYNPPYNDWVFTDDEDFLKNSTGKIYIKK